MTSSTAPRPIGLAPTNDDLNRELQQRAANWRANPAMRTLIDDYTKSHLVLAIAAGVVTVLCAAAAWRLWLRTARAPHVGPPTWTRERRLYAVAAGCCTMLGLVFALLTAANVSNAVDPVPGFVAASAHPTPNSLAVDSAVIRWVQSGSDSVPTAVQQKVDDRLAWQLPKAIVCGLLMVGAAVLLVRWWRLLVRRARARDVGQSVRLRGPLAASAAMSMVLLLTMVMFLGNLQGSIAPVAISVLGGS